MKRYIIGIIVAVLAVGGLIGFTLAAREDETPATANTTSTASSTTDMLSHEQGDNSDVSEETNSVTIENFAYRPSKITVKKGTTVTWTNRDSTQHNIMPDTVSDDFEGSELLDRGESYSFTFDKTGTYTYHCTPHPEMTGQVEVIE